MGREETDLVVPFYHKGVGWDLKTVIGWLVTPDHLNSFGTPGRGHNKDVVVED